MAVPHRTDAEEFRDADAWEGMVRGLAEHKLNPITPCQSQPPCPEDGLVDEVEQIPRPLRSCWVVEEAIPRGRKPHHLVSRTHDPKQRRRSFRGARRQLLGDEENPGHGGRSDRILIAPFSSCRSVDEVDLRVAVVIYERVRRLARLVEPGPLAPSVRSIPH